MKTIEELRTFFCNDKFAMAQGIQIDAVDENSVTCSMPLRDDQRNALGFAHGGIIGTLADFTFAVAANSRWASSVTLNSSMHYIGVAAGGRLTAVGQMKKGAGHISLFEVQVLDGEGTLIAMGTFTGYSKNGD